MTNAEILEWLRGKIDEAEKAVLARERMSACYKGGTDAEWKAAGAIHPDTAGKPFPRAERLRESATQARIAEKLRRDVEMLKAAYYAIARQ